MLMTLLEYGIWNVDETRCLLYPNLAKFLHWLERETSSKLPQTQKSTCVQVPLQGMLFHQCTYFQARDFSINNLRMVSMELTLLWLAGQSFYCLHTTNLSCHFTCQWSLNPHRYRNYTWRRHMYSCLLPACAFITHHTASGCGYFSPHEAGLEKGCGELCCRSHWKVCE